MITHHCNECHEQVDEFCANHPSAMVDSVHSTDGTDAHERRLRGLGRYAYRIGRNAAQSVGFASNALSRDLDTYERRLVMAGWRDERSEAND